jgi:hypothetical protein
LNESFRRLFPTRAPALLLLPLVVAACIDDPTGPSALSIRTVGASPDTMWIGAPGEPIPTGVAIRITNLQSGEPVAGATVTWEAFGHNAVVVHGSAQSDAKGLATAVWQLGTSADEEQQLLVSVRSGQRNGQFRLRALAVPHVVAQLRLSVDSSTVVRLGDSLPIGVTAVDPFGNVFAPAAARLSSSDSTVGTVAGSVFVAGPRRGVTELEIVSDNVTARIPLRVVQHVAAIVPQTSALSFTSLGAELPIGYAVLDDRGRVVAETTAVLSVADTTVAQLSDTLVRASKAGSTELRFTVGTATTTIPVSVQQRVASLQLQRDTVRFDALRDTTTIQFVATDSLGFQVLNPDLVYDLSDGQVATLAGASLLEATNPGVAALTLRDPITGVSVTIPIIVQQRVATLQVFPIVFDALGDTLPIAVIALDRLGSAVVGPSLAYSIDDPGVATIESGGRLRSHGDGRAVVTVSDLDNGTTGSAYVVVWQRVASLALSADSLAFDALGDSVSLSFVARDRLGYLTTTADVSYSSSDAMRADVSVGGVVRSRSNGSTMVICQSNDGPADTLNVVVAQRFSRIHVDRDTLLFESLNAVLQVPAIPVDRLGSPVAGVGLSYSVDDPSVVDVDSTGQARAVATGSAEVLVTTGLDTARVALRVTQRLVRVVFPSDTIRFSALNDTMTLQATALDSLGFPVPVAVQISSVSDTSVLEVLSPATVRARAAGTAVVALTAAGLQSQAVVEVTPVPAEIEAGLDNPDRIQMITLDSLIPLSCRVRDRNGNVIDTMPSVVPSAAGRWTGQTCSDLRAQRSGFDTVRVRAGGVEADVPIMLAVRPVVSSPVGDYLQVDSLPAGTFQFSPSARRNSRGQMEIYFAAYPQNAGTWSALRTHLHRLVSSDGVRWVYDGVALQHNDSLCTMDGNGIEDVSIVPRADGPGWRMFFSAGGFNCYGWQVFSAVSADERTWVKEPGVRLTNGAAPPPAAPSAVPWPVGEGMVTEQLPSGEWRMIVGGYEHILPREDKFQLVEWRSPDQLSWSYVGPVLTTRDMPPAGQGTISHPSIREIAPGLWRMIFQGDDRFRSGWRGRIFSAVSTDQRSWQVEGELMGSPQTSFWACSLVDDRLVVIRQDVGAQRRLAIATIGMP